MRFTIGHRCSHWSSSPASVRATPAPIRPFNFSAAGRGDFSHSPHHRPRIMVASFVPTPATMMLGLWRGEGLKAPRPAAEELEGPVGAGVALTLAGLLLQWLHLCPIVKRIWTSAYTLYSGGLVILLLAAFYAVIELQGWRRWAFPLLVIGANSIAAYVMSWTMEKFVSGALLRHLGSGPFAVLGAPFEPVLRGAAVLMIFWLLLLWMYRRLIFLPIYTSPKPVTLL